MAIDLI